MENCIFCKVINKHVPHYRVYEDEKVVAFLDINPIVRGHVLVIPKDHSRWLWDIKDEDYLYLTKKAKDIALTLRKTFETDWIEEIVAGIGVPHTHIHLFPNLLPSPR